MRVVDFWVGVPLTFLVTLWYKTMRFFGLKDPCYAELPHNILCIELAEMGSTVLAYPALTILQEMFPEATIHFLVFRQHAATAEINERIQAEHVITIEARGMWPFMRDTCLAIRECRRKRIDTVVNLEMFARYSTIMSYLSGAKKRVGFYRFYQEGLYTGDFLTHKVPYNPHIHTASSFITLVRALSEPQSDTPLGKFTIDESKLILPKRKATQAGMERIWDILRSVDPHISTKNRLVLVNPNASKLIEVRKWPIEQYTLLVKKIVEENSDVYALITGSESEKMEGEYIKKLVHSDRVLNIAGKTTLSELLDLFTIACVLVTNDSGPAHFAALTDIHIIVFFGPETPLLYKPLSDNCTVFYASFACSPCVSAYNQRKTPCNSNMCLKVIEVESVYAKVQEVLSTPPPATLPRTRSPSPHP